MKSAKILIISNGALARNPRVLKEASTLAAAGHQVTVLTVRNHAGAEVQDAAIMATARFRRETVEALPGGGRSIPGPLLRRLRTWAARQAVARLGWQTPAALGPAAALLRRARGRPSDLVIVHNEVAHWVGTRLRAEGRVVAADLEDWHSEDLRPEDRVARPLRLLRRVEHTLLHGAAYTSTTSEVLAAALHERYGGRRPAVITNAFPLQPVPHQPLPGEVPAFFWFSQTIGPGRGLEPFLAAWAQTVRPSRVVLLGAADPAYLARLRAALPPARQPELTVLPLVSPAELPAVIARHAIGLALEESAITSRDLTITNKILQYLNAGLAVVASDTAGQREVLARGPEAGILVRLPDRPGLTAALDELLAQPAALAARQRAARQLAESIYCWEREAPKLLGLVEGVL